jgi:O-antigen/teichoic acid export membrane protein
MNGPRFWSCFGFGKWIFLSTVAGFLMQHGDRVILGKYITLTELAFYNIAFMIATIPEILNGALIQRILFPLSVQQAPRRERARTAPRPCGRASC